MKRALLIVVVLVLGATPAPPEAPRPGQLLAEPSAAVAAPRRPQTEQPADLQLAPDEPAHQGDPWQPRPAVLQRLAVGRARPAPARSLFRLLRRTSQGPPPTSRLA